MLSSARLYIKDPPRSRRPFSIPVLLSFFSPLLVPISPFHHSTLPILIPPLRSLCLCSFPSLSLSHLLLACSSSSSSPISTFSSALTCEKSTDHPRLNLHSRPPALRVLLSFLPSLHPSSPLSLSTSILHLSYNGAHGSSPVVLIHIRPVAGSAAACHCLLGVLAALPLGLA